MSASLPLEVLRPLVAILVITTFFGSVLVPLILTLIFFSTAQSRRHPVFILNIAACCCGICEAALSLAVTIGMIIDPSQLVSKSLYVATSTIALISGIFVDSILLFRILAFYPFSVTPTPKFVAIFTLPVLAKCGRFGLAMVYIYQFTHFHSPNIETAAQAIWPRNPFVLTYTALQVLDNSYASGILLYKINQFRQERNEFSKLSSRNLLTRLRSLFIIALGNFVFPVAINIVSIIMLAANAKFFQVSIVYLVDNYISIVGIVFATIWTRRRYWNRHDDSTPGSDEFQVETHRRAAPFTYNNTQTMLSTIHFGSRSENIESVNDSMIISVQGKGKEENIDSDLSSSYPSLTKA